MKETRISAFIAQDVKKDLERYVRARGLKTGYVIEPALRHHLQALKEIPEEYVVPATLVVTNESFSAILKKAKNLPNPRSALRKLMRGGSIDKEALL